VKQFLIELMCSIGFHEWCSVAASRPTRACIHCEQKQQTFRGAGGDDWMDIE
jgi:hypothetical protein